MDPISACNTFQELLIVRDFSVCVVTYQFASMGLCSAFARRLCIIGILNRHLTNLLAMLSEVRGCIVTISKLTYVIHNLLFA